jgi:hypothetical protein
VKFTNLATAVVAIITACVLIQTARWYEQPAAAQQDPTSISNQFSGSTTIFLDTNGTRTAYFPDGSYTTLPFGTNGAASSTITKLTATTATITTASGGTFTNQILMPVTFYAPGSNGVPIAAKLYVSKGGTNLTMVSGTTTSSFASIAGTIAGQ